MTSRLVPPPTVAPFRVNTWLQSILGAIVLLSCGCSRAPSSAPGETYDAGAVFHARTPKLSHTFQVKNTTGRSVKIIGETHSCTCTKVDVAIRTLKPGETIPLTMEVAIPTQEADMNLSTTLQTNDKQLPAWTYRLTFRSYPLAKLDPPRIVLKNTVGAKTADAAPVAYLDVFDPDDARLPRIEDLDAPEDLDVQFGKTPEVLALADGIQRLRFPLTIRPKRLPNETATLSHPLNFLTRETRVSSMVIWETRGPLAAKPSSISFGLLHKSGVHKPVRIQVRSTDGKPFRLLGWTDTDAAVDVVMSPDATTRKPEHGVEIVFDPSRSQGRRVLSGTTTLRTDLNGESVCSVHWSAFLSQDSLSAE